MYDLQIILADNFLSRSIIYESHSHRNNTVIYRNKLRCDFANRYSVISRL